jgi:hypothetical protein
MAAGSEVFRSLRAGGVTFDKKKFAHQHRLFKDQGASLAEDTLNAFGQGSILNFFDNSVVDNSKHNHPKSMSETTKKRKQSAPVTNEPRAKRARSKKNKAAKTDVESDEDESLSIFSSLPVHSGKAEESKGHIGAHEEEIRCFRRRMRIKVQGSEAPDPLQVDVHILPTAMP